MAVVAEHSTDDQEKVKPDREGGELRPKGVQQTDNTDKYGEQK